MGCLTVGRSAPSHRSLYHPETPMGRRSPAPMNHAGFDVAKGHPRYIETGVRVHHVLVRERGIPIPAKPIDMNGVWTNCREEP